MTVTELDDILQKVTNTLRANERTVTKELLDTMEKATTEIRKNPAVFSALAALLSVDVNSMLSHLGSVDEFVSMQRQLLQEGTGQKIIQIIEKLRQKPLLMKGISWLV